MTYEPIGHLHITGKPQFISAQQDVFRQRILLQSPGFVFAYQV